MPSALATSHDYASAAVSRRTGYLLCSCVLAIAFPSRADVIAGRPPVLTFEPSSGTVPAQGQLALAVTFAPSSAAPVNFNIMCTIKKKPIPLSLNVKGEGYAVHDSLQLQQADGHLVDLSADTPNYLDFGQVGHCCLTFLPCCTRLCLYIGALAEHAQAES